MTSGVRQLGAALGVSAKTATQYINDPSWRLGRGPWGAKAIVAAKAWKRQVYPADGEPGEDPSLLSNDAGSTGVLAEIRRLPVKTRVQVQKMLESIASIKVDREMKLGGLVRKEDVDRERVERVQAVRQEMSRVRLQAVKLQGQDLLACEKILEEWARGVCRKFERGE